MTETLGQGDYEILETCITGDGVIPITSEKQLRKLAQDAHNAFLGFRDFVSGMNADTAKQIRFLRVDKGCSWRRVAELVHQALLEQTGENMWQPPSNQLMGMALCEKAAQLYGEDYGDNVWNG